VPQISLPHFQRPNGVSAYFVKVYLLTLWDTAYVVSGADSMGHGGTCPARAPYFYKWLGTGGTVSIRTANKKLTELYWPSRKRSPKRLIVLLEPKSGGARPTTKRRIGAPPPHFCSEPVPPTFKFVPAPLYVVPKYASEKKSKMFTYTTRRSPRWIGDALLSPTTTRHLHCNFSCLRYAFCDEKNRTSFLYLAV